MGAPKMLRFRPARLRHLPVEALLAAVMLTGCATAEPQVTAEPAVVNPSSAQTALKQADEVLARGDFAAARKSYRKVLTLSPSSSAAQLGLGEVELAAGGPPPALDPFPSVG